MPSLLARAARSLSAGPSFIPRPCMIMIMVMAVVMVVVMMMVVMMVVVM